METYKDLYQMSELKFGEFVRATNDKQLIGQAKWLLFEYIEWRLKKEKEFQDATSKRDDKKDDPNKSSSDEADQFTFGKHSGPEQ